MESVRIEPSIEVRPCSLGLGVFARRAFSPGDEILRFEGPEIGLREALAKGDSHANVLQIADSRYLDLIEPCVRVNHSCAPNSGVVDDRILIAIVPIRVGDEIFFDYSTTMGDGTLQMQCRCGSSNCRSVIGDFGELPFDTQRVYLYLGIVSSFIREREEKRHPRG